MEYVCFLYCSVYICQGADKENLWKQSWGFLVGDHVCYSWLLPIDWISRSSWSVSILPGFPSNPTWREALILCQGFTVCGANYWKMMLQYKCFVFSTRCFMFVGLILLTEVIIMYQAKNVVRGSIMNLFFLCVCVNRKKVKLFINVKFSYVKGRGHYEMQKSSATQLTLLLTKWWLKRLRIAAKL